MRTDDALVNAVSLKIADHIRKRAGLAGLSTLTSLKRVCRDEFGIKVRSLLLPFDFKGEVRGDREADRAVIYINAAMPTSIQLHVLIHELAECLVMRGAAGIADIPGAAGFIGTASPIELRHLIAVAVEAKLTAEIGIDRPRSSWSIAELLCVIPLDPKYQRPRPEIERIRWDD